MEETVGKEKGETEGKKNYFRDLLTIGEQKEI